MYHYIKFDLSQCPYLRVFSPACWGIQQASGRSNNDNQVDGSTMAPDGTLAMVIFMAENQVDGVQPPGDGNKMLNRNPK